MYWHELMFSPLDMSSKLYELLEDTDQTESVLTGWQVFVAVGSD